ncbi:MAG: hypothetical protein ACJAVT_002305 [Yoonia sp.]|jgi:hypothetical protein
MIINIDDVGLSPRVRCFGAQAYPRRLYLLHDAWGNLGRRRWTAFSEKAAASNLLEGNLADDKSKC